EGCVRAALERRGLFVSCGRSWVLAEVSAAVEHGEWVALIGPNGAGKSTLLRALAGLVAFTGGASVQDQDVGALARRQLAMLIALVPQRPTTPSELTVAEYVLLGRTPHIGYFATERLSDRLAAELAVARLDLRTFVA